MFCDSLKKKAQMSIKMSTTKEPVAPHNNEEYSISSPNQSICDEEGDYDSYQSYVMNQRKDTLDSYERFSFEERGMYSMANQIHEFKTSSSKDDECENKVHVASLLLVNSENIGKSPRSLAELERANIQIDEDDQDNECYVADREDNESERRRHTPKRRKSPDKQRNKDLEELDLVLPQNDLQPILPPPLIKRKKPIDELFHQFDSEVSTTKAQHKRLRLDSCPSNDDTDEFSISKPKLSPSTAGMYPSSYDTIGSGYSGYGSLDYSSGTDHSHDTVQASNRRERNQAGKRSRRHKGIPKLYSNVNNVEQLPLVPEDQLIKCDEASCHSESSSSFIEAMKQHDEEQQLTEENVAKRSSTRKALFIRTLGQVRGYKQPPYCNDIFFAILFWFQLIFILILAMVFGPKAFGDNLNTKNNTVVSSGVVVFTYQNFIILTVGCGIVAMVMSSVLLLFITTSAERVIPMTLFISMILALLWSLIGLYLSPQSFIPVMGLATFGISVAYTFIVWDRIGFVTSTLKTAIAALKDEYSMILLACMMQVLALIGIIFYTCTCIGIYNYFQIEQKLLPQGWKIACYVGLGVSFTWTFQVVSVSIRFL